MRIPLVAARRHVGPVALGDLEVVRAEEHAFVPVDRAGCHGLSPDRVRANVDVYFVSPERRCCPLAFVPYDPVKPPNRQSLPRPGIPQRLANILRLANLRDRTIL